MFNFGMTSNINKAARVPRHCAIAINHIHSNLVLNIKIQAGLIKADISDDLPIFFDYKMPK